MIAFEYFPLKKINSVPSEATAFRRDTSPAILVLTVWPGEKNSELVEGKTRVEITREASNKIAEMLTQGKAELSLGYTNYGELRVCLRHHHGDECIIFRC
jgi:hypothetical protein